MTELRQISLIISNNENNVSFNRHLEDNEKNRRPKTAETDARA